MATTNPFAMLSPVDEDDDVNESNKGIENNNTSARREKRFHQTAKGRKNVFVGHMATKMDWQWILERAATCGRVMSSSPVLHIQYKASLSAQTLAKGTKCYYWATITMATTDEAAALIGEIGNSKYRATNKGDRFKPRIYAEWGK